MRALATSTAVAPEQHDAGKQGDLLGLLAAYTEVTSRLQESHERLKGEVVRLRDELAAKNRELRRRERLASLGQMAAGLAHEIRNPLGGIVLYASLLEQELARREDLVGIVRRIASGAEDLNQLVTNILAFARPHEPSKQLVGLREILTPVVNAIRPIIEDKSARLLLPEGDGLIFVDAEEFGRALTNLLRNAAEAVAQAGTVQMRARWGAGGAAVIWIEDDGPGVQDELTERIFEPFMTTKHNGTGLGLAIVHQIIEANGGRIQLKRSRLGGAKFCIRVAGGEDAPNTEPVQTESKHVQGVCS